MKHIIEQLKALGFGDDDAETSGADTVDVIAENFGDICRALETHDELVAALQELKEAVEYTPLGVRGIKSVERARAVLAKAKGESQ